MFPTPDEFSYASIEELEEVLDLQYKGPGWYFEDRDDEECLYIQETDISNNKTDYDVYIFDKSIVPMMDLLTNIVNAKQRRIVKCD